MSAEQEQDHWESFEQQWYTYSQRRQKWSRPLLLSGLTYLGRLGEQHFQILSLLLSTGSSGPELCWVHAETIPASNLQYNPFLPTSEVLPVQKKGFIEDHKAAPFHHWVLSSELLSDSFNGFKIFERFLRTPVAFLKRTSSNGGFRLRTKVNHWELLKLHPCNFWVPSPETGALVTIIVKILESSGNSSNPLSSLSKTESLLFGSISYDTRIINSTQISIKAFPIIFPCATIQTNHLNYPFQNQL